MPSIVQEPMINSVGFMHKDRLSEPVISGFTAVNGRGTPPQSQRSNGVSSVNGMLNDTIQVRPASRNSSEESQDRKFSLPSASHWNSRQTNGADNGRGIDTPPLSNRNGTPESQGKRKRSNSAEELSDQAQEAQSSYSRRRIEQYGPIERDESPRTVQVAARPVEPPSQNHYASMEREGTERSWGARERQETVMTESTQQDPRHMDPNDNSSTTSPDAGPSIQGAANSQNTMDPSSTTEMTRAGVQVDPKKRKRQFANRTKTGCQTCRRRKKKCDEGKPECNNCTRGGFICEGYANKSAWPKHSMVKGHVPLQAKDRYRNDQSMYHNHGQVREPYTDPNIPGGHRIDGIRARPIVVEEHDRQATRNTWSNGWPEPPRPAYSEHSHQPDYTQSPNFSTHARPPPTEYVDHQGPPPIAQRPSTTHSYSQPPPSVNTSQPALTAHLALQHQAQTAHPPQAIHPPHGPPPPHAPPPAHTVAHQAPKPPKSEKEKMISGEHYLMFNDQLVDEREQCRHALYRFNKTDSPTTGISREERHRVFRSILEPTWARHWRASDGSTLKGSLGSGVCVEAPFYCTYGYNVHIGEDCVIGANCTFEDAARITIGAKTIIGPGVMFLTNTVSTDPSRRQGNRGTCASKEIRIGENVWIGGNVTINPGVTIGKGSMIYPGSVVTQDMNIGNFKEAEGNPAQLRRGIFKEPEYRR